MLAALMDSRLLLPFVLTFLRVLFVFSVAFEAEKR
jgi:hypothetical protein